MAVVFEENRGHRRALEWYQRALNGKEQTLGKDHASTLDTAHNMANGFREQGKNRAQEWYQLALDGFEKTLGNDHPNILRVARHRGTLNTLVRRATPPDQERKPRLWRWVLTNFTGRNSHKEQIG
jgi:hypothetical protein